MKHAEIIAKMTVEEKAAILSGASEWESREIKRLGIPAAFFSDGPHGVRKQEGEGDHLGLNASVPATCFPTAATIANSWDESLGEEIGKALGEEASALGVDVLLGPGLNIKRSPLCGRNFEYFSEDPYLAGKMAASYVRGIQSQGIYACPKHFAVNSQELRRMAMNSVLDERTLREIYLTGFEIAIKEGKAKSIMTSYNEVNGVYANENEHLLKEILREEWGFDGLVVTDWGASNDHVKGVACRSNLEMPAPGLDAAREVLAALEEGSLSMEELDQILAKKEQEKDTDGDSGLDMKVKYLCITMDDGYYSNYDLAYPVFRKYNVPATIFVVTDYITNQIGLKKFTWSNASEMINNSKVGIYNHTSNHVPAGKTTTEDFVAAALAGEEALEANLPTRRTSVKALAYPNGQNTPELQQALLDEGFSLLFTIEPGVINRNTSRGAIPRIMVSSGMTGADIVARIEQTAARTMGS